MFFTKVFYFILFFNFSLYRFVASCYLVKLCVADNCFVCHVLHTKGLIGN